jgi:hypothetical protein
VKAANVPEQPSVLLLQVPGSKLHTRTAASKEVQMTLEQRFERMEAMLVLLVERQQVREWYSVEEFARIVGRAECTCREWCRCGRVRGEKRLSGRGAFTAWVISHGELQRYQRAGLLPCQRPSGSVTSDGDSP